MGSRSTATRLSAAAAGLALLAAPLAVAPAQAAPDDQPAARAGAKTVKVMTRNLYLGTNIMRPINAYASVDPEDPECQDICYQLKVLNAVGNATDTARDIVDETDFAVRAKLLAAELAAQKPHLVGLQEVALWRSGPMDDPLGPDLLVPNATTVDMDFLKMLLSELKAQGARYKAVSVNWLSDVEAPAFEGGYPGHTNARDVRMTMRDVILMRKGSGLKVLNKKTRKFKAENMLRIEMAGKPIDFRRGYQWVDVRKKGAGKFRFVNSHFEAFSSDIAFGQAQEVVNRAGSYKDTTIFVCDCNSDPLDQSIKTGIGDTRRHSAPYWFITGKSPFHDTWLQHAEAHHGWTSGLNERVNADDASGFDHRIDMVFARTGDGRRLKVLGGTVTGDEVADRDEATGLWPSDHAGVVMRLRLP